MQKKSHICIFCFPIIESSCALNRTKLEFLYVFFSDTMSIFQIVDVLSGISKKMSFFPCAWQFCTWSEEIRKVAGKIFGLLNSGDIFYNLNVCSSKGQNNLPSRMVNSNLYSALWISDVEAFGRLTISPKLSKLCSMSRYINEVQKNGPSPIFIKFENWTLGYILHNI